MTSYTYSYTSYKTPRSTSNIYYNAALHMTYHPLVLYYHIAYYYKAGYFSEQFDFTYYDGYGYNFYYGGYGYYEYSDHPSEAEALK